MHLNGISRKMAMVLIGLVMGSTAAWAGSSQDSWLQTAEGMVQQETTNVGQDFANLGGSAGSAKNVKLSTASGKTSKTSKKKTSKGKSAKTSKKKSKKTTSGQRRPKKSKSAAQ